MVTGIEQYHFERAGYFVRRGLLSAERLEAFRRAPTASPPEEIVALAADLLGARGHPIAAEWATAPAARVWRREAGPPVDSPAEAQVAELARCPLVVEVRLALDEDGGLLVVPGSHAPDTPEAVLRATAGAVDAVVPEAVHIRIAAGDCLLMSGALLRTEEAPEAPVARMRFQLREAS